MADLAAAVQESTILTRPLLHPSGERKTDSDKNAVLPLLLWQPPPTEWIETSTASKAVETKPVRVCLVEPFNLLLFFLQIMAMSTSQITQ